MAIILPLSPKLIPKANCYRFKTSQNLLKNKENKLIHHSKNKMEPILSVQQSYQRRTIISIHIYQRLGTPFKNGEEYSNWDKKLFLRCFHVIKQRLTPQL